jgi:hypothetical protein
MDQDGPGVHRCRGDKTIDGSDSGLSVVTEVHREFHNGLALGGQFGHRGCQGGDRLPPECIRVRSMQDSRVCLEQREDGNARRHVWIVYQLVHAARAWLAEGIRQNRRAIEDVGQSYCSRLASSSRSRIRSATALSPGLSICASIP